MSNLQGQAAGKARPPGLARPEGPLKLPTRSPARAPTLTPYFSSRPKSANGLETCGKLRTTAESRGERESQKPPRFPRDFWLSRESGPHCVLCFARKVSRGRVSASSPIGKRRLRAAVVLCFRRFGFRELNDSSGLLHWMMPRGAKSWLEPETYPASCKRRAGP